MEAIRQRNLCGLYLLSMEYGGLVHIDLLEGVSNTIYSTYRSRGKNTDETDPTGPHFFVIDLDSLVYQKPSYDMLGEAPSLKTDLPSEQLATKCHARVACQTCPAFVANQAVNVAWKANVDLSPETKNF